MKLPPFVHEAVAVIREAWRAHRNPAVLFSGGKDSLTVLKLCELAFLPSRPVLQLLHIDTGQNFPEVENLLDRLASRPDRRVHRWRLDNAIARALARGEAVTPEGRNRLQSSVLREAIAQLGLDAVLGGARRDEDRARAKERFFSLRDQAGGWNPQAQRPEPWNLFNLSLPTGSHFRVFPINNWTELDVWRFAEAFELELPALYFSHERLCRRHEDGTLTSWRAEWGGTPDRLRVRCRTVGDMATTGLLVSQASTPSEILAELAASRRSERSGRRDDAFSPYSLEERKREGYF